MPASWYRSYVDTTVVCSEENNSYSLIRPLGLPPRWTRAILA